MKAKPEMVEGPGGVHAISQRAQYGSYGAQGCGAQSIQEILKSKKASGTKRLKLAFRNGQPPYAQFFSISCHVLYAIRTPPAIWTPVHSQPRIGDT
jgi:hypothetical protein